jgi:hypothetical protein
MGRKKQKTNVGMILNERDDDINSDRQGLSSSRSFPSDYQHEFQSVPSSRYNSLRDEDRPSQAIVVSIVESRSREVCICKLDMQYVSLSVPI